jgi:hypothetical protein
MKRSASAIVLRGEARRIGAVRQTIAGIRIPDTALAREVTDFVRDASTPLLFDHSRRVFLCDVHPRQPPARLSQGRALARLSG